MKNITKFFKAFSLAEMMVVMLVLTIVMAASMPIISKRAKMKATTVATTPAVQVLSIVNAGEHCGSESYNVGTDAFHTTIYSCQNNNWTTISVNVPVVPEGSPCGSSPSNIAIDSSSPTTLTCQSGNWTRPPSTSVPTGTIVAYYGSTAPSGWLLCDGSSTSGYSALAALVGSTTPDLRGIFIRGAGTSAIHTKYNGAAYSGGNVGTYQYDQMADHTHGYDRPSGTGVGGGSGGSVIRSYSSGTTTSVSGARVGVETNPANLSLTYIIKY